MAMSCCYNNHQTTTVNVSCHFPRQHNTLLPCVVPLSQSLFSVNLITVYLLYAVGGR